MKSLFRLFAMASTAAVLVSCVSTGYTGKSYPETSDLLILKSSSDKSGYELIGTGHASGEYSGTTNGELRNKLYDLGLAHGADAMQIVGVRLIAGENAVNMEPYNFIEAADDPDQTQFETSFQESVSGDPNAGTRQYRRVMYAEYYRKKLDKQL